MGAAKALTATITEGSVEKEGGDSGEDEKEEDLSIIKQGTVLKNSSSKGKDEVFILRLFVCDFP